MRACITHRFRLNSEMPDAGGNWVNSHGSESRPTPDPVLPPPRLYPPGENKFISLIPSPTGFPVKPYQSNGCEPPISYGPLAHAHAITSASVGARAVHHLAITGLSSHPTPLPITCYARASLPALRRSLSSLPLFLLLPFPIPTKPNHDPKQKRCPQRKTRSTAPPPPPPPNPQFQGALLLAVASSI